MPNINFPSNPQENDLYSFNGNTWIYNGYAWLIISTGTSGASGIPGTSGTSGANGSSGATGSSGQSGSSGTVEMVLQQ